MIKKEKIYKKTNGKCIYCGCDIKIDDFHMDHVIPKSTKDGCGQSRLFPSCKMCNLYKAHLSVEEFRIKLEEGIFKRSVANVFVAYHKLKKRKVIFYFEKAGINIYE